MDSGIFYKQHVTHEIFQMLAKNDRLIFQDNETGEEATYSKGIAVQLDPSKGYVVTFPNVSDEFIHKEAEKISKMKPGDIYVTNRMPVIKEQLKKGAPFP